MGSTSLAWPCCKRVLFSQPFFIGGSRVGNVAATFLVMASRCLHFSVGVTSTTPCPCSTATACPSRLGDLSKSERTVVTPFSSYTFDFVRAPRLCQLFKRSH